MELYLFIIFVLILVSIVMLLVLRGVIGNNNKKMRRIIDEWQKQNRYMENTVKVYEKALALTDEISTSIEAVCIADEEGCIRKCETLLSAVNGADTALGVLIFEKKQRCLDSGIKFTDEIRFIPSKNQIKEIASVCIMGNAIDNAIEALLKVDDDKIEKNIRVQSMCRKNLWILKIINPISEKNIIDKELKTTKTDKENHGHGINIIRMLADKYNGEVKIAGKKNTFEISVYMPMKKA